MELLVVIIIIGILSAIALPSFLNQANKARQSEARTYVGSINRAQQARFMEAGEFTTQLAQLGLGIQSQTANYTYTLAIGDLGATDKGALAKGQGGDVLRSYVGLTFTGATGEGERTTFALLCESNDAGVDLTGQAVATVCPADFSKL
ncbi:MAG: type IV pilin-like G/H family protein [Arthrospira sp. SH-MAG29]|nr:type IV pilin-like G/H family protein [Arthrospira sp. SH-MAG29]